MDSTGFSSVVHDSPLESSVFNTWDLVSFLMLPFVEVLFLGNHLDTLFVPMAFCGTRERWFHPSEAGLYQLLLGRKEL